MTRFYKMTVASAALLAGLSIAGPINAQSGIYPSTGEDAFEAFQVAGLSYATIIVQLENAGYEVIDMKSTMLGRIKIRAQNRIHLREIVVSRSTGEIKRDVILKVFGASGNSAISSPLGQAQQATGGGATANVGVSSSGAGANVSVGGASVSVSTENGISIGN